MKQQKIAASVAAVLVLLILCLSVCTGCCHSATAAGSITAERVEADAVAVVAGCHACSKTLNLTSTLVENTVFSALRRFGTVSVISVDGAPSLAAQDRFDIAEQYRHADARKLDRDVQTRTELLLMQIAALRADDPEVDTLEALRLAARSLSGAGADQTKAILVLDTGLSTCGLLNFTNNLLSAEPEAVVEQLKERNGVPELQGITVVWQQLGDVAAPQEPLSPALLQRLEAIWRGVVEAGGGSFVYAGELPLSGEADPALPAVTPVSLPAEAPIAFDAASADFSVPQFLTQEQVRFLPDSAAYADPDAAAAVIRPIADHLNAAPDFRLLLVGTTAGDGDTDFARTLSADRAEAVKATLSGMGVDGGRILTLGLGSSDPWHIAGVGTDSAAAEQNRKVVLLDAGSDTARSLLG